MLDIVPSLLWNIRDIVDCVKLFISDLGLSGQGPHLGPPETQDDEEQSNL